MKVKLIKESSGFGFNSTVANWIVKDEENLVLLEKIKQGFDVEIPDSIAKNIQNLVCIETGEIISKVFKLNISSDEVSKKYKSTQAEIKKEIKEQIQEVKIKKISKLPKMKQLEVDEIDGIEESTDLKE